MQLPTDILSERARRVLDIDSAAYQKLVVIGAGNPAAKELLEGVSGGDVFVEGSKKTVEDGNSVLAGLWLFYDWLDESHAISQSNHSPTGSFWHAIMHRREGDFSNSKYWYARVVGHPVLKTLAAQAGAIVNRAPADTSLLRLVAGEWNCNVFVDFVESMSVDQGDPRYSIAVQLQQMEWRALFEYCSRA